MKSSSWSGREPVALAQQRRRCLRCRARCRLRLANLTQIESTERSLGLVAADHAAPSGVERHEDDVVLVLPEGRWPLGASTPTTLNGTLRTRIVWSSGSSLAEQVRGDGLAEDGDDLAAPHLLRLEQPRPSATLPFAGGELVGSTP